MLTAIILAAGESTRMNTPKALLKIGEETFAEHICRKVREAGIPFTLMVTGAHDLQIREALQKNLDISFEFNRNYEAGQFSSLKEGLRNLPTGADSALVWLVDQPLVKTETVRSLIDAFQKNKQPVTIPVCNGRRGHPVIYDLQAIRMILSLKSDHTAKDLQAIYAGKILLVEVDDPGVLIDIDTPEDYKIHILNS